MPAICLLIKYYLELYWSAFISDHGLLLMFDSNLPILPPLHVQKVSVTSSIYCDKRKFDKYCNRVVHNDNRKIAKTKTAN